MMLWMIWMSQSIVMSYERLERRTVRLKDGGVNWNNSVCSILVSIGRGDLFYSFYINIFQIFSINIFQVNSKWN